MFARPVRIGNSVYRSHVAACIEHTRERTVVRASSREMADGTGHAIDTWHVRDLDDSLTFAAAEEWLKSLDAFAEVEDPAQRALDSVLEILTDEQAESVPDAFPAWMAGTAYAVGARVRYEGDLYKCVQAHTSQADWAPDATPALWARIGEPGEVPVWVQPTGAQDAYGKGDRVLYPDADGSVYESTIDSNVWSPDDYPQGWSPVSE
jgi:hypothetical protein